MPERPPELLQNVVELPIHLMLPKANIPAGLNPLVVMAVAHSLRNAGDGGWGPGLTEPITVKTDGHVFRIMEGRHRWMAHWLAGKSTARCLIEGDLA